MSTVTVSEERGVIAFNLETNIKAVKGNISANLFAMAAILKTVRDEQYYKELGHDMFRDWLSSPEITISPAWASKMISIYEYYIEKKQMQVSDLQQIDTAKLYGIIAVVEDKPEEFDSWFEKAKQLRRIDLEREVQEYKIEKKKQKMLENAPSSVINPQNINTILYGEAIDLMKTLPKQSVDALITRLPIVISKKNAQYHKVTSDFIVVDTEDKVVEFYLNFMKEFAPLMKKDSTVCFVVNYLNLNHAFNIAYSSSLHIIRDIIWYKRASSVMHNPFKLIHKHETVLWATVSRSYVENIVDSEPDVWEIDNENFFFDKLIGLVTYEGQTVLDPFARNHVVIDAAKSLSRNYIGIDNSSIVSL